MSRPRFAPPPRRVKRHAALLNGLGAIGNSQPTAPQEVSRIMVMIRTAWQLLREGNGTDKEADRVGAALNVGIVRAEEIDAELVAIMLAAGQAMAEAQRIHEEHGRYGFTGPGLVAIGRGLDVYEEILAASSPLQMHNAMLEVARRVRQLQVIRPP